MIFGLEATCADFMDTESKFVRLTVGDRIYMEIPPFWTPVQFQDRPLCIPSQQMFYVDVAGGPPLRGYALVVLNGRVYRRPKNEGVRS